MKKYENISGLFTAIYSISFLSIAAILNALLSFGTQILLAKNLTPNDLGVFSAALSSVVILVPLSGFGLAHFWLKAYGEEKFNSARWLKSSYLLMATTSSLAMLAIWTWSYFDISGSILQILSICIIGQAIIEILGAKYQIEGKYGYLSIISLFQNLLRFLMVCSLLICCKDLFNLTNIAFSYAISAAIIICFSSFELKRFSKNLSKSYCETVVNQDDAVKAVAIKTSRLYRKTWPFALATCFQLIYYQSDIIMIKLLHSPAEAGYYNVAFVIIAATYILPNTIFQRYLLPKVHHWSKHDAIKLRQVFRYGVQSMSIIGFIVMVGLNIFSTDLILIVFGEQYHNSIDPLNILAFAAPFTYVSYSVGVLLMTADNIKTKMFYMGLTALFNIVANLFMIPKYGANGAAITTALSAVLLLFLYFIGVKRNFNGATWGKR